jgi:AraC-like DNA-binding protein
MVRDLPFAAVRPTGLARVFYWARDFSWLPPALPDFDLWCILEGRGEASLGGRDYALVPGVNFVLRPGDRPVARHDPTHPLVAFYCHFDMLDKHGRRLPAARVQTPPPGMQVRDLSGFTAMAGRCVAGFDRNDPLGQRQGRLALELMLATLWDWWQQPLSTTDEAMARVVREIQRQPGKPWDVETMAGVARLSRSQFTRRFTSHTGRSPKAFVIETRLDVARQLIMETEMSLSDVAEDLGYSDLFFFSRQFKQLYASPPSQLRKSH